MIFSHVLYQLSYPGIASAAVRGRTGERWSGPMAKGLRLGNPEITFPSFFFQFRARRGASGYGVALVQPLEQVTIAAARGAERRMFGLAGFAADGAGAVGTGHDGIACAKPPSSASPASAS
jgi:hypothetical protein